MAFPRTHITEGRLSSSSRQLYCSRIASEHPARMERKPGGRQKKILQKFNSLFKLLFGSPFLYHHENSSENKWSIIEDSGGRIWQI